MKNVGMNKVPETIDELHEVLKRFTFDDPDGDGTKNTYGMTGDIRNWNQSFSEIYGAYGAQPFNWVERNGKIVYGGLQPEVRDVLQVLQNWYREGIIHPDFITDDLYTTAVEKFQNGIIGINQSSYNGVRESDKSAPKSIVAVTKKNNPMAEFINGHPVKGPEGKQGKFIWGKALHVVSFGKQLKEKPEKINLLLQMMNDMATDVELAKQLRMGEEGKTWDLKIPEIGSHGGVKMLPPFDNTERLMKETYSGMLSGISFYALFPMQKEALDNYTTYEELAMRETYKKESYALTDYFIKPDAVPYAGVYLIDLREKQLEIMARIILGEKSVEEYDEFIECWNHNGGDILTREANKLNGQMESIFQQLQLP